MTRMDRDQLGLLLAHAWSTRGTCARRRVGCVLMDADGRQLSAGYNGPSSGLPHCVDEPCPGAAYASGVGLDDCVAVHAEQNAIAFCGDVRLIHTAYVTVSPCVSCVKLLLNTGCMRVVFAAPYAHDEAARRLWLSTHARADGLLWIRRWSHVVPGWELNVGLGALLPEGLGS